MTIGVRCRCGKELRVKENLSGKTTTCPACERPLRVPQAADTIDNGDSPAKIATDVDNELDFYQRLTDSVASNPGRLRVSFVRHFLCFPKYPSMVLMVALITAGLAVLMHWSIGIVSVLAVAVLGYHFIKVRATFNAGAVNPACVISVEPPLIAVFTNLTKVGEDDWHVIKILPHPLGRMSGGLPQVGERIPTVATYVDDHGGPHWLDFDPVAVRCGTANEAEIEFVTDSIPPQEWDALEKGLKHVPDPHEPGLYKIGLGPTSGHAPGRLTASDMEALIDTYIPHDEDAGRYQRVEGIPDDLIDNVRKKSGADVADEDVLVGIQSWGRQEGILLTHDRLIFATDGGRQSGEIRWAEVRDAMVGYSSLEIVLAGGDRRRINRFLFKDENLWHLEALLKVAAETTPDR